MTLSVSFSIGIQVYSLFGLVLVWWATFHDMDTLSRSIFVILSLLVDWVDLLLNLCQSAESLTNVFFSSAIHVAWSKTTLSMFWINHWQLIFVQRVWNLTERVIALSLCSTGRNVSSFLTFDLHNQHVTVFDTSLNRRKHIWGPKQVQEIFLITCSTLVQGRDIFVQDLDTSDFGAFNELWLSLELRNIIFLMDEQWAGFRFSVFKNNALQSHFSHVRIYFVWGLLVQHAFVLILFSWFKIFLNEHFIAHVLLILLFFITLRFLTHKCIYRALYVLIPGFLFYSWLGFQLFWWLFAR